MVVSSIKCLEQRMNLQKEIDKLKELFDKYYITVNNPYGYSAYVYTFPEIINDSFDYFPYCGTSRDLNEFFIDREIYDEDDGYYIYLLNLYSNLLSWLVSENHNLRIDTINTNMVDMFTSRIDLILESQNYKNITDEKLNEHGFYDILTVKRDENIDSVMKFVSQDIRIDLLSYIDFRFENDLKHKEAIISRLYKDIESKKICLNVEPNKSLFKDTMFVLNIPRHHREYNISDEDKLMWYDRAFEMYIHLIRTKEITSYQTELKSIKNIIK